MLHIMSKTIDNQATASVDIIEVDTLRARSGVLTINAISGTTIDGPFVGAPGKDLIIGGASGKDIECTTSIRPNNDNVHQSGTTSKKWITDNCSRVDVSRADREGLFNGSILMTTGFARLPITVTTTLFDAGSNLIRIPRKGMWLFLIHVHVTSSLGKLARIRLRNSTTTLEYEWNEYDDTSGFISYYTHHWCVTCETNDLMEFQYEWTFVPATAFACSVSGSCVLINSFLD